MEHSNWEYQKLSDVEIQILVMKNLKFATALVIFLVSNITVWAQQKLGSNPTTIQKSSVLELESNKQGLLFPRLTDTANINALNPPDGMVVFFTPTKQLLVRANGYWQPITLSGNLLLSNLGDVLMTSPVTNQLLKFNGSKWINFTPNFLTTIDTINIANFYLKVRSLLSPGTGITYNNATGAIGNAGVLSINGNNGVLTMDTGYIANFYQKVRGLSSAAAPITYSNGTIGITQANTTTNGYLSSTDWNTFNSKGGGTITSASVVTANGVSGTVATATTTPAITLTLGNITPTSVTATGALSGTQLTSTIATGTAPLVITSTTPVANLSIGGNAATVTTNANLTGMVTSVGNATTVVTNANLTGEVTSVGNAATLNNAAVIGKTLTGYVSGAGVVAPTDNILQAINKLNGNITAASNATHTGDATGATALTLATVNANVGTFNNVTVNAKGLTTAASNIAYLTTETDPIVKAINGIVKSNGTTIAAAVAGDFPTLNQNTTGNAATATNATTAVNFTGSLSGDVTGTQNATVISSPTVTGKLLTGYVSATGTVAATDNILQAIQKLNGNITAGTNATHTGDATGATALTLATVNANVGTFNNVTVNAKGLTTAASNIAYLTTETDPGVKAINGIVKSNGTTIAAAVAGDFPTLNQNTTGNAATATNATTAVNFTGTLAGDVIGTQGATVISSPTVTGKLLTGYVSGAGVVAPTDNILQAINKLNGNITAASNATHTGDATGATALTLATVNANVGTFNNVTVNAKGLTTAASNIAYLTTETDPTVKAINGIVKSNGTTIAAAVAGDFPTLNQNTTGNAATVTTNANLTGEVTSVGNAATLTNAAVIGKTLTGFVSAPGTIVATDNILQAIQKLNGNNATNANLTGMVTSAGNVTTVVTNANLTGDVTSVGNATTITPNVITNADLNTIATATIKGRITAATGNVEDLTAAQARTILNVADGATNYVHPIGDGNLHVPATSTTNNGKVLTAGATAGSLSWVTPTTGSVTSASVVTANGVSGTVATATTTPAITLTLGAITPASVAATGLMSGSNLVGTNTGDVTIGAANGLSIAGQAISMSTAGSASTGALTSADWNTFNNKLSAVDTISIPGFSQKVRSLFSGIAPISFANGVIGITQANTSTSGYLSNTDWNTFNNKLSVIGFPPYIYSLNNSLGFGTNSLVATSTGTANVSFGDNAMHVNTTGYNNSATGVASLYANTTGYNNVATGFNALNSNTTGYNNTATGAGSLFTNGTGIGNTAVGFNAGYTDGTITTPAALNNATAIGGFAQVTASNSLVLGGTGAYAVNVGIGVTAPAYKLDVNGAGRFIGTNPLMLSGLQVGANTDSILTITGGIVKKLPFTSIISFLPNVYSNGISLGIGTNSLIATSTGIMNTAYGDNALHVNTTGYKNAATGAASLYANTTGYNNTASGFNALNSNTTGYNNTAIGTGTLFPNGTGIGNTALGYNAGYTDGTVSTPATLSNATAIGGFAQVTTSNSLVLGGTGAYAANVGIGTTAPAYKLDVVGTGNFTGNITAANLSGTNTGDITIASANGLSLAGQALSMSTASTTTTGALTNADWNTFNSKGGGSVTSASVVTANGVSGTVATATTTPAITLTLGNITPTSVTATGALSGTQLTSTIATGTAPLVITSTTPVANLSIGGNAATVTTNANLTGMVTSTGNATTVVTNANLTGEVTSVGNAATLNNAAVIGKTLTGYVSGAGTVAASDNILQAINKLNGNITAASNATHTGDATGATALTLATVNANVGTFNNVTVNAKGLTTAASNIAYLTTETDPAVKAINGIVKSNGTTIAAAVAGDFPTLNQNTTGNATTATTAGNFSGSLSGDVTGTQNATVISSPTVTGKLLTGYASATGTIAATDNILQAIQKLNGNITAASNATHTGDATGATALTLATVNANVGTFNNVTVNAKGLTTAASNIAYLTTETDPTVKAINGIVKSNGTTIAAAVAGDFPTLNQNTTGNAATVTTNANLTGMVTSTGNTTTVVTNANLTGEVTSVGNAATLNNAAVIGKTLTGYVSGAGVVAPTDNILQAINKLNGNITAASNATHTGDATGATALTLATVNANVGTFNNVTVNAKGLTTAASNIAYLTTETDPTVKAINGIVKSNGTTIAAAVAGDFPTLNQNTTGNAATVTTNANLTGMVTSVGNTTTVVTNANLTGEVTSVGNAATLNNAAVIGKTLTGYVSGAGIVAPTDNILQAINKLNGNITAASNATHTGDATGATALTLATVNANVGTFNNVTVNAKGLTTAASNIAYLTTETDPTVKAINGIVKSNGTTIAAAVAGDFPTLNQNTTGNAATATNATTAVNFTGSLSGDVSGTQNATVISSPTVTGKLLTGYASATGTVAATDNILQAIQKLNGNITAASNATHTGDATGATALTLATVNANVGTFNNVTVNAKGLTTAASNIAYLTTETDPTVKAINGIVKSNGTTIAAAVAGDFPTLNQNTTGNAATVTTNANLTGEVTSVGNAATLTNAAVIGKTLTGFVSAPGTIAATDNILQAIQKLNGNNATNANLTGMVTSSGNVTTVVTNANLTGDVISAGNVTTITANVVTNADLNTIASNIFKGRITNGNGNVEDLTATQARTILNVADGANNYVHPSGDGNLHVPATSTTNNGKVLTAGATAGSLSWVTPSTGSVTSASVITANGVSGTVATATTTPAITLTLGAITPTSVAATGMMSGANLVGTNTGDVTIGTANGLSIAGQAISMSTASTSSTGALTNTDWNTFNNKANGANYLPLTGGALSGTLNILATNPLTMSGLQIGALTDSMLTILGGTVKKIPISALMGFGTYGTGNANYIVKYTGSNTIANSNLFDNGTNIGIGATAFDGTYPEKLLVNAGATTSVTALRAAGTINNYLQMDIRNASTGNAASSDIVATADNGSETTNYVNMGINGSGYTSGVMGGANDAYLFNVGQNLLLGTGTAAKSLVFMTGGTAQVTNERMRIDGSGNVGIGNNAPAYKLDVNGTGNFTGALTGTSGTFSGDVTAFSDIRLKKNIRPIPSVSESLRKINAVEFDRRDVTLHQVGFIAQNVQQYFPALVNTAQDSAHTLSLNYQAMTSPLLKGWQEHDEIIIKQQKEIDALRKELDELKQLIKNGK